MSFAVGKNLAALASDMPLPEAVAASAGTMGRAARGDHRHKRLTSATNHTLDGSGLATVVFTQSFASEPSLALVALGSGTGPVPDFRGDFIKTGELWTGCTVYGERPRALVTSAPLSGITLVTNLVTALNTIFASLSGYSVREPAAGARVSVIAVTTSTT